jgi:hypothetical protein
MTYSNTRLSQQQQQQQKSLLLVDEEAKMLDFNDKLLLPSSTRSLKRRTSLLEKSRDWVNKKFHFLNNINHSFFSRLDV